MAKIRDEIDREIPSRPHVSRSLADIQRLKLEKLMKNPDRVIIIPEKPKERGPPVVPDFVRNVMGSSAGAGSGEFHVYRHLRRKEYARQHYMHKKAEWELMEDEYHAKIESNKRKADDITAKKRAKRLKKKANRKKGNKSKQDSSSSSDEDEETEEEPITNGHIESSDESKLIASKSESDSIENEQKHLTNGCALQFNGHSDDSDDSRKVIDNHESDCKRSRNEYRCKNEYSKRDDVGTFIEKHEPLCNKG